MTARCEPPPELRNRDGWHWLNAGYDFVCAKWQFRLQVWLLPTNLELVSPWNAAGMYHYRYIAPVPLPDDVARLAGAARAAQARFAEYAVEHVRRGALGKAERNQTHADALRAAVAPFPEPMP